MAEKATIPILATPAGLGRRLAALFYESLLVAAVLMLAGFLYIPVFGGIHGPFQKAVFQLYLLLVMMGYFVVFWRRGQTLAMKTWRIRLSGRDGAPPSTARCVARFWLAALGLLAAGIGLLWALIDPERQFLHDRLLRTRLVEND